MIVFKLQELIHKFEEGAGARVVRYAFFIFTFIGLAVLYDTLCFRNLATVEGMDSAQVARNISEGKGYTTEFIRPFSMYLVSRHRPDHDTLIKQNHPDLANAPVYPVLLAPVLKAVAADEMVAKRNFTVARRDLVIAVFNQVLMLISMLLVFRLARRWFDQAVGFMAAVVFAGTELYWRYSISGLSTNLLIVTILLIALLLTRAEEAVRDTTTPPKVGWIGVAVGLLLGVAALTRYSCAFLVVPMVVFAFLFLQPARARFVTPMLAAFVIVFSPWIARNVVISGTPFGTAGFAWTEQTRSFPEDRLQRLLHPELKQADLSDYLRKFTANMREVVLSDVPKMGGNWISGLFIAGLFVRFQSPKLSRARWFILMSIVCLLPVQALGKTSAWVESPEVNGENLLVLIAPLVSIFGCGVFFVLLDSFEFSTVRTRYAAWISFAAVMLLPMVLAFLPPRPSPIAYPPYYPPRIQQIGQWVKPGELLMSDIAAAVAWYGERKCLQLTALRRDFIDINDFQKPINGLYLTTKTTENKFLANWMRGDRSGWESFVLQTLVQHEVPDGFPLRRAPQALFTEGQVLLMDYERWRGDAK